MNKLHVGFVMMVGWLLFAAPASTALADGPEAPLVLHFASGKAYLGDGEKEKLRQFLQKYETSPKSLVFVVGYTDSVGDRNNNYRLSRDRAQAIRREIISGFGLDASVVIALGKGEENPVGDNRKASGRADNRRVEIHLANTRIRNHNRIYSPGDPQPAEINTLVQDARSLIKKRHLGEAVRLLNKARALGGDHYSDWHATYGIAGFYANAPYEETHAHLATALQLDPYNYLAREYQSRLAARRNVTRGAVTPQMGDSVSNAISVTAVVQQYEYLRLFNVVPMRHRQVEGMPVDAWDCSDAQGVSVTYYFDYSQVYGWAFGKPNAGVQKKTLSELPAGVDAPKTPPADSKEAGSPSTSAATDPKEVWGSKVFK